MLYQLCLPAWAPSYAREIYYDGPEADCFSVKNTLGSTLHFCRAELEDLIRTDCPPTDKDLIIHMFHEAAKCTMRSATVEDSKPRRNILLLFTEEV